MDNDTSNAGAGLAILFGGLGITLEIIGALITIFFVWVFWRIFHKAGYSGAMGLLFLIPGVGWLICILILAFGQWPRDGGGTVYVQAAAPTPVVPVPPAPPAPPAPPVGGPPVAT